MNLSPNGGNDRMPTVKRGDSEMIRARDERRTLVFALSNGSTIEGVVRWFDDDAIGIADENRDETTLYKHAVLYFKSKP